MQEDPQEFEKLRKLLALKRREMPPPGYFDGFSSKVTSRIEAAQLASPSLWQQVASLFRTRPAITWSFSAFAVMVLFVASNGFDQQPAANQANSLPTFGEPRSSATSASLALATNRSSGIFGPARIALEPVGGVQTNAEPKLDSLFSTPFYHQVRPASYAP